MLDIKTVFFILASSHLIGAVVLMFLAHSYTEIAGIKEWAIGRTLVAAALCFYMSRLAIPVELSVFLGNGLLCLGLYSALRGNCKVVARAPQISLKQFALLLLLLLAVLMYWTIINYSYVYRVSLMSLVTTAFMLLLIDSIRPRSKQQRSLGKRLLIFSYATQALSESSKALALLFSTQPENHLFTAQSVTALPMFIAACASIITTVGYFALVVETLNKRLIALSDIDSLTQTLNRRALLEKAKVLVEQQKPPYQTAILFIDIDNFKLINDTHGHASGDCVLQQVANTLAQQLGEAPLLARFGGEEFVVILPDTSEKLALAIGENIRSAIEAMTPVLTAIGRVTCSVGVTTSAQKQNADLFFALLHEADSAMYHAKQNGKNRVSLYKPKMKRVKQEQQQSPLEVNLEL